MSSMPPSSRCRPVPTNRLKYFSGLNSLRYKFDHLIELILRFIFVYSKVQFSINTLIPRTPKSKPKHQLTHTNRFLDSKHSTICNASNSYYNSHHNRIAYSPTPYISISTLPPQFFKPHHFARSTINHHSTYTTQFGETQTKLTKLP